mgnify:CR=1 FL=1
MDNQQPEGSGRPLVFYDGSCPLCRREIAHYRRQDRAGALGWVDDYAMIQAIRRLKSPPLTSEDFGGMVTAKRLLRHCC